MLFAEVANHESELEEEMEKLKAVIHNQRDELRLTERELTQRNMEVDTVCLNNNSNKTIFTVP